MPWDPRFKKGTDIPTWDWLTPFPDRISYHGTGNAYDGKRYLYYYIQHGSGGTPSSTSLWRYDTWTEGWAHLTGGPQSGWVGLDLEYDAVRNVLIAIHGNSSLAIHVFNLNTTAVTVAGVNCNPWVWTSLPNLPAGSSTSASLAWADDASVAGDLTVANGAIATDGGTALASSTATSLVVAAPENTFGYGLVNMIARFTTGALAGQRRLITAVPDNTTLTTAAFTAAPAAGDKFVVEVPEGTASAGTTTTVTLTGAGWATNAYAFSDVVIVAGTGAGQRRRIESNTADTLTLTAAYAAPAANARVGPFTTAPDATSVFRIVPSSDFLYYMQASNTTNFYRIDLAQTGAAATWAARAALPGTAQGGANLMYPQQFDPFGLIALRGNGTKDVYAYDIGTNTWSIRPVFGGEVFNTGASSAIMHGKRKMVVFVNGAVRSVMYDLTTGIQDVGPTQPYANPGGFDGKRARYVKTPEGVEWLYQQRAGGQELFRVPLEWLV